MLCFSCIGLNAQELTLQKDLSVHTDKPRFTLRVATYEDSATTCIIPASVTTFKTLHVNLQRKLTGEAIQKDLRSKINILSYYNNSNAQFIIIDTNNNCDFRDDPVYDTATLRSMLQDRKSFTTVRNLLLYDSVHNIFYSGSARIKLDIFRQVFGPKKEGLLAVEAIIESLPHIYQFSSNNEYYQIHALSNDPSTLFNKSSSFLYIKKRDEDYPKDIPMILYYRPGEIYQDESVTFRINSIQPDAKTASVTLLGNDFKFRGYRVNNLAPDFTATVLSSTEKLTLSQFQDKKYTLLEFWGTWCIPCKQTTPALKELYSEYGRAVEFVGIAFDKSPAPVIEYAGKTNIRWKNVFVDMNDKSPSTIPRLFNVESYPTFILIDKKGRIKFREDGLEGPEKLKSWLEKLPKK
jgi:thiol-disulfide isomerase/thioredoxin